MDGLEKKSGWTTCLVGCLVAFVVGSLLCAGVGIYIYSHAKGWATQVARQAIAATIEESDLPEDEKLAIRQQVERVAQAFEDDRISVEQLGRIMQDLVEAKIWGLAVVQGIEAKYIEPSGLTDEEKAEGKKTISRVLRGAVEGSISDAEIETLSSHFLSTPAGADGPRQLKENLTDEELRAMLTDARELADSKDIPEEEFEFRFSERIREIVDQALDEAGP
jgi:hypothetical protein